MISELTNLIAISFAVFAVSQTAIYVAYLLVDQLKNLGWIDHERD